MASDALVLINLHRCAALLLGLLLWAAAFTANVHAAGQPRILLLHSFGPQFAPWNFISASFREAIIKQSPTRVDIYEVSLESARYQQPEEQAPFVDYIQSLFAGRELDSIVAMGAPAARFVQRYRSRLFPNVPVIISAADERAVDFAKLTANETAVVTRLDLPGLIEDILKVLPKTNRIAMVLGSSPLDQFWTRQLQTELQGFMDRITFEWLNDLPYEGLLNHLSNLPADSAIFFGELRVDGTGVPRDGDRVLASIKAASKAPIFSYIDCYLGEGIVGGRLLSSKVIGERIAESAIRILSKESAGSIRTPTLVAEPPIYDARELRRAGISESNLPPGSEVRFRELSVWDQYRWHIASIAAALLLQTVLISWLFYEHRRRSVAEISSRNSIAELANMNRFATAGELSASIAHEINQPITGMVLKASAALHWLQAEKPNVEKARAALSDIVDGGHHASEIIGTIRAMFKKGPPAKASVDLNRKIEIVLALVRGDLQSEGVRIQTELDQLLPAVAGDPVQLQQVILNLVVNAADAMRTVQPRILKIRSSRTESGNARVSIEDTGTGIPEADRDRIFEPLFTTKSGGMGMGLSICRSIVKSHRGKIWIVPADKRGTIFEVELPGTDASDPTKPPIRPAGSC